TISFFPKIDLLEFRPPPPSPANQRKDRGGYSFLRPQAMEEMEDDGFFPAKLGSLSRLPGSL
ncbi:hypothetical protein L195_g061722, partial [Trifolium pratense]